MIRVNSLCDLYEKAYQEDDARALADLTALVKLAGDRGYRDGRSLLQTGLDPAAVRRICWNVSSVLEDRDFLNRGLNLGKR